MNLVDMHIHTANSFDSSLTLDEILTELSGVVTAITLTDHDYISEIAQKDLNALEEKYHIKVICESVEISTLQGDILAYGITSVPSRRLSAEEVIEIIHSDGGIAVAAHPFTLLGVGDLIYDLDLDAIEINGSKSTVSNQQAKEAAILLELPCVGGSDSHTRFDIGTCATKFTKPIKSVKDIIKQVKKGECSPVFLR